MWRSWDVAGKAGAYLAARKWWILFFVLLAVRACSASAIFIIASHAFAACMRRSWPVVVLYIRSRRSGG